MSSSVNKKVPSYSLKPTKIANAFIGLGAAYLSAKEVAGQSGGVTVTTLPGSPEGMPAPCSGVFWNSGATIEINSQDCPTRYFGVFGCFDNGGPVDSKQFQQQEANVANPSLFAKNLNSNSLNVDVAQKFKTSVEKDGCDFAPETACTTFPLDNFPNLTMTSCSVSVPGTSDEINQLAQSLANTNILSSSSTGPGPDSSTAEASSTGESSSSSEASSTGESSSSAQGSSSAESSSGEGSSAASTGQESSSSGAIFSSSDFPSSSAATSSGAASSSVPFSSSSAVIYCSSTGSIEHEDSSNLFESKLFVGSVVGGIFFLILACGVGYITFRDKERKKQLRELDSESGGGGEQQMQELNFSNSNSAADAEANVQAHYKFTGEQQTHNPNPNQPTSLTSPSSSQTSADNNTKENSDTSLRKPLLTSNNNSGYGTHLSSSSSSLDLV